MIYPEVKLPRKLINELILSLIGLKNNTFVNLIDLLDVENLLFSVYAHKPLDIDKWYITYVRHSNWIYNEAYLN